MQRIEVSERIAATRESVWALVSDHEGMKRWAGVREVVLRKPGSPDPNGEGAIRTVRAFGIVLDERITAFEPCERLAYTVVEGAPLLSHRGEVVLTPDGDATRVTWRVDFEPLVPGTGWLLECLLRRGLAASLAGLKQRLESARATGPSLQREIEWPIRPS